MDEADLIVVNMCSVRHSAVDRIFGFQPKFEKLKAKNNKLKTILTGCILKQDKRKFQNFFDYILEKKDLLILPRILNTKKVFKRLAIASEIKTNLKYLKIQPKYSSFPVAYVPISSGCNNFCAYCVVPYTRGRELCRPAEDIFKEVKNLVKKGYKEIWLLGQNVNSYKCKMQNAKCKITNQNSKLINFPKLLKLVNDIPGDFWIRFTSSHPKDFSDELIEVMVECKKVTPYLNLPVQSGDNEILRKMNRNYTVEEYKNLVKKIREKIPDITLSTDIIVGFPR
jgi:tRNA-2-methylthio-N6-dimethylallyladenosine synthase